MLGDIRDGHEHLLVDAINRSKNIVFKVGIRVLYLLIFTIRYKWEEDTPKINTTKRRALMFHFDGMTLMSRIDHMLLTLLCCFSFLFSFCEAPCFQNGHGQRGQILLVTSEKRNLVMDFRDVVFGDSEVAF